MEVSNNDIARILGRLEAKLDAQAESTQQVQQAVASLDGKVEQRLNEHDQRLRELEVANPKKLAETVAGHAKRIEALEKGAARNGVIAGLGSGVAMSVLLELLRKKIGL